MNYNLLLKILMKWGLENNNYDIVHYLYMEAKIGISVKYLYSLPEKSNYNNLSTFLDENVTIHSNSIEMRDILCNLKYSKYERLPEWDNLYGYRIK